MLVIYTMLKVLQIVHSSAPHNALKVHKELVAGKAKLEYCVHVKTHSLLIDLTKCLPARKVIFHQPMFKIMHMLNFVPFVIHSASLLFPKSHIWGLECFSKDTL